ncbi:MAG: D-galactosyl-beta-1-4-L-rhamnose phosphorylase, partial [Lachnospiraceae bacterium]|nr:D-galactosyl-beta-1-4-L-rhamnose phosphorylase [Lachnospiraceae bacterium]
EANGIPTLTVHDFGKGKGIYMAGFEKNNANTRMLLNLLLYAKGLEGEKYLTDDADTECAYYPGSRRLVLINNSEEEKTAKVATANGVNVFTLKPFETKIISE